LRPGHGTDSQIRMCLNGTEARLTKAFSIQVSTEIRVPHPFRALCGKGGRPEKPISTVIFQAESALEQRLDCLRLASICTSRLDTSPA